MTKELIVKDKWFQIKVNKEVKTENESNISCAIPGENLQDALMFCFKQPKIKYVTVCMIKDNDGVFAAVFGENVCFEEENYAKTKKG